MTITPDPRNANKGTQRGRGLLEKSLREYGAGRSVLADRNGVLIAGNKTHEVATEIGLPVRVIETDGNELVVVQRTDLDLATDKAAVELGIADNRVGQVSLEWDVEVLAGLAAEEIDLSKFWSEDEIAALLGTPKPVADDPGAQVDKAAELQGKWQVHKGELWEVDGHWLMCGDATDEMQVSRLLRGVVPYIITDPPYSSGGFGAHQRSAGTFGAIANDNLSEEGYLALIERALGAVSQASCCYVFTDWRMWHRTLQAAEVKGFKARNMIVWDKRTPGLGSPWRTQHELIYFGRRDSGPAHGGKYGNVLSVQRSGNVNYETEKPVDLISQLIDNTEGGVVYDPFVGSGTTIVAAQQMGCVGFGMDVEPKRIAVALERLTGLGLDARRLD